MTHLYKINLENGDIDLFFKALDLTKRTVTFMIISKEGVVIKHPDAVDSAITMPYIIGDEFTIINIGHFPIIHFEKLKEYFHDVSEQQSIVL